MDSINRSQPEDNHEDLTDSAAIERIKSVVKDASSTCFFRTSVALGESGGVRPMAVQQVDDEGHLWFLSADDSHKNAEIARDPAVQLFLQASAHSNFLHLKGRATISRDKQKIKELWQPIVKTWFTGGVEDPRITVIEVIPTDGYYWDTKHGKTIAGVKMLIGAMIGKTLDDSIEGKVAV